MDEARDVRPGVRAGRQTSVATQHAASLHPAAFRRRVRIILPMSRRILVIAAFALLAACVPEAPTSAPFATPTATAVPAASATSAPPPVLNPLTGLPALEPDLLDTPATLISISHFPATGRPQAGLSFAPFVYEVSITEGATRFLAVFYGGFPAPESAPNGGCVERAAPFARNGSDFILGGRVFLDENDSGALDGREGGVGAACVALFDAGGNSLSQTTTDSNGYYGFNVAPGHYTVAVLKPLWSLSSDSTAQDTAAQAEVDLAADRTTLHFPLSVQDPSVLPSDPTLLPLPQVGPIRSGRLVYRYLADSFANSCLIFAGASSEVFVKLPSCYLVYHQLAGGGYMLDIDELRQVAKQNRREQGRDFDYSGYVFSDEPPPGGVPANLLHVFIAYQNQSSWTYDPLYESYLRSVDTSEKDTAGLLFPDRDRLTGRQIHFENVIVLLARHEVLSPTNLDIHLDPGKAGDGLLFRDGMMYDIEWSMPPADSRSRLLTFTDTTGAPMPLKPGHTWVIIITPFSTIEQKFAGQWMLRFYPPEGAQ